MKYCYSHYSINVFFQNLEEILDYELVLTFKTSSVLNVNTNLLPTHIFRGFLLKTRQLLVENKFSLSSDFTKDPEIIAKKIKDLASVNELGDLLYKITLKNINNDKYEILCQKMKKN
jgi:hypothetical protein